MKTDADLRRYRTAIVIGVDRKIQYFIPGIAPNDPRTLLRLRFHDFLSEITDGYVVDVICEEAKDGLESIAETMANREQVPYRNIEMSVQRRAELGIPLLFTIDLPGAEIPAEQIVKWNAFRESDMVDELLHAAADARVLVVVCSVSHLPVLVQILQLKFRRVAQYDVTAMPWFDRSLL
jgi:hypothetical protein